MSSLPFALLEVFVAAVETGSFAAAARRLHRTRSAVGKGIARLEAQLGVRLFVRDTRHSTLTERVACSTTTRCARRPSCCRPWPRWKAAATSPAAACA